MVSQELAARFAALYNGYTRAHGRSVIKKTNDAGKAVARSWTEHQPVVLGLYEAHLNGQGNEGLGIIMLRDDDESCNFGAIDIDDYNADLLAVEKKIASLGLPLVVVRSKSGGAHLTCFCEEPTAASVLQQKLSEWAALLGYSAKTEIFPKQTGRASGGDVGNFLNLPYFNASETARYGLYQGKAMTLEEFLDYAESRRCSLTQFREIKYTAGDPKDVFYEGPPCLQYLQDNGGFAQGTMRMGMFDVGVYLRKRYPDDYAEYLVEYNRIMCNPPLRNDEIQGIIKSLGKKDYQYQCKQPPIMDHCQRKLCLSRRFGVGDDGPQSAGLEITAVTRYQVEGTDDPPLWGMEIGGRRLLIENHIFYERDAFNKACLAAISRVPIHVPPSRWMRIVDELAANADIVLTPKELSQTGNLWEWIVAYLMGAKATAMEQIAVSGGYKEEGFVYFRALDLFMFLDQRKVQYKNKQKVFHLLKEHGGSSSYRNFKKGGFNVWKVPLPHGEEASELEETPSFVQKTPF